MNTKTDPAPDAEPPRKPRLSLFFATAAGAGYLPKAPGTWGSLIGIAIYCLIVRWWFRGGVGLAVWRVDQRKLQMLLDSRAAADALLFSLPIAVCILVALLGVVASRRVASYAKKKDPQFVVIDEVSGVIVTLLLGLSVAWYPSSTVHNPDFVGYALLFYLRLLNWKYLLLGFILFRVFDIWKPFPARQAESLPGGWGIMADDWIAAVYAALGIWIARGLGL
ncbi:MAG TPA: phosphatidylglycerophosphatase A [Candidatus Acidoferrales bacterium]|nr:phosphatidylglycerophosphatase A [Candidatus Acidoferrales bacterium]